MLTIACWITPDGKIEDVSIGDSSGVAALDEVALKSVRDASPLDPLPAEVGAHRVNISIVLWYSGTSAPAHAPAPGSSYAYNCRGPQPGPPLDRIDVFGLLAEANAPDLGVHMLCVHGINFVPDSGFSENLAAYRANSKSLELLGSIKPAAVVDPAPNRAQAYAALDLKSHPDAGGFHSTDHNRTIRKGN